MNWSPLFAKLALALGLTLVVLAVGTSVSQAGHCCNGIPSCPGESVATDCVAGVCTNVGLLCWTCKCEPDFFHQDCVCD